MRHRSVLRVCESVCVAVWSPTDARDPATPVYIGEWRMAVGGRRIGVLAGGIWLLITKSTCQLAGVLQRL